MKLISQKTFMVVLFLSKTVEMSAVLVQNLACTDNALALRQKQMCRGANFVNNIYRYISAVPETFDPLRCSYVTAGTWAIYCRAVQQASQCQ